MITAKPKTMIAVLPAWSSRYASSVHSVVIEPSSSLPAEGLAWSRSRRPSWSPAPPPR